MRADFRIGFSPSSIFSMVNTLYDYNACGQKGVITMKTIEAFLREIEETAPLQDELKAIQDMDALAAFLKKYDVSGTVEDFAKALNPKAESEGEISDDDADAVAGGIQAGDFLTKVRPEFLLPSYKRPQVESLPEKRYPDVL